MDGRTDGAAGTGAGSRATSRGRRRDAGRRRIPREELAVWRGWLRAHALVVRRLEADLLREQELPLASYDVLVQLVEAPDRRLRMTELADAVLISRSGLTRLVDRLEGEGLVRREPCVDDARGLNAVLTDAGYERLRQASSTHLRGVDDYVLSRLSTEELGQLDAILGKLLAPLPPTAHPSP